MEDIKFYTVKEDYIEMLSQYAPHLFLNSRVGQANSRKYIGIVLTVNGMDYFAPLSSFKRKHRDMKETLDFIKVKNYADINLNNMFPVIEGVYEFVDFSKENNQDYRSLLLAEYRYIKSIQEKIRKNAVTLYRYKYNPVNASTNLSKRCNDFKLLEEISIKYKNG